MHSAGEYWPSQLTLKFAVAVGLCLTAWHCGAPRSQPSGTNAQKPSARDSRTKTSTGVPPQCSAVDLRATLGPVRFQDDKSWCYAFAAADLLTYRFRKEMKDRPVSAVYTALTYTKKYDRDPYSDAGGFARYAIIAAEHRGFCPQNLEDEALHRGPQGSLSQKLETLRSLKLLYDSGNQVELDRQLEVLTKSHSVVAEVPHQDLMRALRKSSKRTFPIVFCDLLCGDDRYKPPADTREKSMVKWVSGTPRLLRAIDNQLSRENIVAIGYYSAFLIMGSGAPQTEQHMSVIVGRRWNPNLDQCEYLIRNSFGPDCIEYAREFRSPENCQNGHIWVPRDVLSKNLYAITYIK